MGNFVFAECENQHATGARSPDRCSALLQQIGPVLLSPSPCLFPPPLRDFAVVTRQQDIRHRPSAEFRWPRVLRSFEQTTAETVVCRRLLVSEHARKQSD